MIKFIAKVVFNKNVSIDKSVPTIYRAGLIFRYFVGYARGCLKLFPGVFLEANVKVRCRSKVVLKKNVVIRGSSLIDGMGSDGITIGSNSSIGRYSTLIVSGSIADIGKGIVVGKNCGFGDFCHIGGAGGVAIGDDTISGSFLSIHPENHNFKDRNVVIRLQGVNRLGISIGKGCWIGAKVTILDGVEIGNNCIIAAGAVVTEGQYRDNSIIAGVPAKIVGDR